MTDAMTMRSKLLTLTLISILTMACGVLGPGGESAPGGDDTAAAEDGSSTEAADDTTGDDATGVDATATGEATEERMLPEDADLALARKLMETDSRVLFGAGSEEDSRLLADIKADIGDLDFENDPEGLELARTLFGENPLLSAENPLVTDEDRQQWLAAAIRTVGRDKALEHLRAEAQKLASGEVDRAHWYEHVAACERVCNKVVSGLLHAHVRRVRELPHKLVLFPTDSKDVTGDQLREVDALLAEVVRRGGTGDTEMLLIGRASRTGAKAYNRRLSEQRVASVRGALQSRGIPGDHVHGFGLGYEPPQITEEIARAYDLDPTLTSEQRNRSVLVVAHLPGADGGDGGGTRTASAPGR